MNRHEYIAALGQMLSGMERAGAAICRMETGRGPPALPAEPGRAIINTDTSQLPFFLYFLSTLFGKRLSGRAAFSLSFSHRKTGGIRWMPPVLLFGEKFARLLYVFIDRRAQRFDGFKLLFRPQELVQLDMDHLAVQVSRKIEQMRLDGRRAAVHKGSA